MASTVPGTITAFRRRIAPHGPILAVLSLSGLLNGWALANVGWGNAYYSAAVRSMMHSWHNFVFASFEPGGFVSVDKPPLSLWVQTISAKVFGFNQMSLLVPQAVAGVLSVCLKTACEHADRGQHDTVIAEPRVGRAARPGHIDDGAHAVDERHDVHGPAPGAHGKRAGRLPAHGTTVCTSNFPGSPRL